MVRKPYRLESTYRKDGVLQHYIVRDVRTGGHKTKVKKYLGCGEQPSKEEFERFRILYAYDLELRAAKKVGKLGIAIYRTDYLSKEYIDAIEEIRYLYKRFTDSLTIDEISVYEKQFEIRYIQGTTALEGNTLSVEEAENLLNYGIIPQSKSLREINEVQNFRNVKTYRDSYKGKIDLDFIRKLHAIIMHDISRNAGQFRKTDDTVISGYDSSLCPSIEIENELTKIIDFYYKRLKENYHPYEEAVMFHYFFETIHPFSDGNGRVGREIFNFMLMKKGYPKLLFLGKDRDNYILALKNGNNDRFVEMISIFADIIINQRLAILRNRLKEYIEEPKKSGQTTLASFITP
jgi:Fic family protein